MSKPSTYRVFVSAVTGELGSYRTEVARALRRKGIEVRDQEHFRQGGATLLEQLRDYIRDCDAVVLLVGDQCGDFPTAEHAAAIGTVPTFESSRAATGQNRASYTQWEFFLAKHYGNQTYTFLTGGGFVPDGPNTETSDERACQQAYRGWIEQTGEHRDPLTSHAKLVEDVLVLPFPDLGRPKPVALPYPSIGTLFKGRDEFLRQLRASLHRAGDGQATAIIGKAVHGLGGVGKTRLAVEYAWQHADNYSAVLFVVADSPQKLRQDLAALVGPLVLDLPEQQATEEEVKVAAALRWLHEHPGWFLILDNVDTEEAARHVEDLLARLHGGQVLITGRLTRWSRGVEPLELDVLTESAAVEFLLQATKTGRRRLSAEVDQAQAQQLAAELGQLALALEQAAAYIERQRLSFGEYLELWRSHVPAVQEWHDQRTMKYPRSVAVTWQTTLDQLGPGEVALLRLLAWLAPDPIPLFVLGLSDSANSAPLRETSSSESSRRGAGHAEQVNKIWRDTVAWLSRAEHPIPPASAPQSSKDSALESQATHAHDLRDALATLADFSMVRWNPADATVTVHRVLQEILRTRQPDPVPCLTAALQLLDQARPAGDPGDVRT